MKLSLSEGHESKLSTFFPATKDLNGVLSPSRPLDRQSIMPDEAVYYRFNDLLPLFTYEVKLSYPATVRCFLLLTLTDFISMLRRANF